MKTPNAITLYRRARTAFDHLTLYIMLPSVKIIEDFDYETTWRGLTKFEIDLPTYIKWTEGKDHWTVSARVLGFGLTLTRQSGY